MTSRPACSIDLESAVGRYGERDAVGPVSARLEGPGLFWVLGPNGSGKSTLLRMAAGLKRPATGRVLWSEHGHELTRDELRGRLALASPDIHLYEELSARENLELVARLRGADDPSAAAREALESAGLLLRSGERPRALSSGLRQRLRLAAAWVRGPAILLLDEPSSNLDEAGRAWLWQDIRRRASSALCVIATNQSSEVGPSEPRLDLSGERT